MKNVYFIGIGGIGMSALARYYKFKGYNVAGYDRTPSDLSFALEAEGIDVHYQDQPELLPEDKNETLVVYTPAISADLGELVKAREEGYLLLKRSRTLGEVAKGQRCLAVAGTHGKTTTSTLIAHILTHSGEGCSAFLGGISRNYGTNLLMSENPTIVAEADEFDRTPTTWTFTATMRMWWKPSRPSPRRLAASLLPRKASRWARPIPRPRCTPTIIRTHRPIFIR